MASGAQEQPLVVLQNVVSEMYKLMLMSPMAVPSNADAERNISVQNGMMSKLCSPLIITGLDELIRLS